jgi:hypothetical protein
MDFTCNEYSFLICTYLDISGLLTLLIYYLGSSCTLISLSDPHTVCLCLSSIPLLSYQCLSGYGPWGSAVTHRSQWFSSWFIIQLHIAFRIRIYLTISNVIHINRKLSPRWTHTRWNQENRSSRSRVIPETISSTSHFTNNSSWFSYQHTSNLSVRDVLYINRKPSSSPTQARWNRANPPSGSQDIPASLSYKDSLGKLLFLTQRTPNPCPLVTYYISIESPEFAAHSGGWVIEIHFADLELFLETWFLT